MTDKSSNFRVRLDPELHEQFLATCKGLDIPASQVIRQLMRSYIEQNHDKAQSPLFNKNSNPL